MAIITKPFRATSSLATLQSIIKPGELVELIDPDGGPSSFFLMDRNGHLHNVPFSLTSPNV